MENENKENKSEMTPTQFLMMLACVAVIGILMLINAHWHTIVRWIETLFWVAIVAGVLFVVLQILDQRNLIYNPFDPYARLKRQKDKDIRRFLRGRPYKKLSAQEKQHVQRIENHYQNEIDKLYD